MAELDALQLDTLSPADRVDAQILAAELRSRLYGLQELRDHEWDPLVANPGTAIYTLLAREFAPLGDRLRSAAGRLHAVPAALDTARGSLHGMPRVHVETAIGQFAGTRTLLATELERALTQEPALRAEIEPVRDRGHRGDRHAHRLAAVPARQRRQSASPGSARRSSPASSLSPSTPRATPTPSSSRAESDLVRVEEHIAETAARLDPNGSTPDRYDGCSTGSRPTARSPTRRSSGCASRRCSRAPSSSSSSDLVTVYDDPVKIIVMPEIHRGVAVAYCDPPGPLEQESLPTYFAVSPTPEDWSAERVQSFYREYNAHMLHNLTVHEAMPGHVQQLAHNSRYTADVKVRKALWSGSFVEGWAVYAEQLMADAGYRSDEGLADASRMQQLKMQLRMTINAILDARVHAHGMTEQEAMRLMMDRGHQEEGRGRREVAAGAADQRSAVHLLRRLRRGRPTSLAISPPPAPARRCASATTRCCPTARRPPATCAPSSPSDPTPQQPRSCTRGSWRTLTTIMHSWFLAHSHHDHALVVPSAHQTSRPNHWCMIVAEGVGEPPLHDRGGGGGRTAVA